MWHTRKSWGFAERKKISQNPISHRISIRRTEKKQNRKMFTKSLERNVLVLCAAAIMLIDCCYSATFITPPISHPGRFYSYVFRYLCGVTRPNHFPLDKVPYIGIRSEPCDHKHQSKLPYKSDFDQPECNDWLDLLIRFISQFITFRSSRQMLWTGHNASFKARPRYVSAAWLH